MTLTCPRCQGPCDPPIPADVEGPDGHMVSRCPTCRTDWIESPEPVDLSAVRAAVAEVRERRPLLGPSCYGRRHGRCDAYLCECPCHWLVAA